MKKNVQATPTQTPDIHTATAPDGGKKVWRCVHDGSELLAAFETDGTTQSIHTIADFETRETMDAAITELGLKVDPVIYTLPEPQTLSQQPGIHVH